MENIENIPTKRTSRVPTIPSVLVVGADESAISHLQRAALGSALGLVKQSTIVSAAAWLETMKPAAVLVDLKVLLAGDLISSLRRSPRWADVPVIGLSETLNEVVFADTFRAGGDDVVRPWDTEQLVLRLRSAQRRSAPGLARPRRLAVVAGADPEFRMAAGRVLAGAGFEVESVIGVAELTAAVHDRRTTLVVASDELPNGSALAVLEAARDAGCELPFVLSVHRRHLPRAQLRTRKLRNVALCDRAAAPDEILYAANEILLAPAETRRKAPRLPYGACTWIRAVGTGEDVVGFSYNVSTGGAFVRTLYPFAPGDAVWLEIAPPRSERRVRLSAHVTWHRPFGPLGPALTPAGSGFQITGGLPGELSLWENGVRELQQALAGP